MDIRFTRGLDQINLNKWFQDPQILACLPCSDEDEKMNFLRTWMYYAHKKAGLSLVVNDHVIGMGVLILMPYQKVQHHAVLQMIVQSDFQKQGYGTALLKNMCHLAKNYLNLEVLFVEYFGPESHLQFLKNHRFEIYGIQKGYVEGPFPDKYLLEHRL